MRVPKTLRNALLWALGAAMLTSLLLEPMSFGLAHGGEALLVFFVGALVAMQRDWPGQESLLMLFLYQLAYYVAWAIAISFVVGLFRVRAERLRAERERNHAS